MKITCDNGAELKISKVVQIDTNKNFIHLDELKDGSYRLIYSKNLYNLDNNIIKNITIERRK